MYAKQILASGITTKRFFIQISLILLLNGIISASSVIFGWGLEVLAIISMFAGGGLSNTASLILSRVTQFWAIFVFTILVGLIPFITLKGYCYFQIEGIACTIRSVTANTIAFWFFPSLMLWIPWIVEPLGKARRRYG